MKHLLLLYPRRWRERYGDELLALLEAEPLTWRVRADVARSGLAERLRGSGPPALPVLWAWSLFVIGGTAFQKTSEHWQGVVPSGDRGVPAAAFDTLVAGAAVGGAAVIAAVALALPALARDLGNGGWDALRRPILVACGTTGVSAGALVAVALGHDVVAASIFVVFAVVSLFAWTHTASVAARRLRPIRAHSYLALVAGAAMVVMTIAAATWFVSVTANAPSFVSAAQLAVTGAFMLAGVALAGAAGLRSLRA